MAYAILGFCGLWTKQISTLVGDALSLKSTADVWGGNNDGENNQAFVEFTLSGRGLYKQMRCVCIVAGFVEMLKQGAIITNCI